MQLLKNNKIKLLLIILFILLIVIIPKLSKTSTQTDGVESFPESYKPYLQVLKEKYPNWNFVALYTNLDWDYVIDNENIFGKNLVPKSYTDSWKNTKTGEYNVEVDAGWVDCSRSAVEYAIDPRNFLNEVRLFQFETLSYDSNTNNLNGIEKILYGTEFYNTIVKYLDSNGNTITTNKKYSDLVLTAGITSKVSTYHLASRIKQEVGPFLSHSSISGNVEGFKGLYNFYNIGATSSTEPMGAIKNGLQFAKDGKGASTETKSKYLIPWNTKERSITGGAIFIGSSYINVGQNTVYLQKFDVNDNASGNLFTHQYMTNVLAPYNESKSVYNGYNNSGILNSSLTFIIPVYNNMPSLPCQSPSISQSDYIYDNTKMYANVSTTLNVRSGPGNSYEIITTLSSKEEVTRIAKGQQSGELWDRVILQNGIVGYVFQSYLQKVPEIQVSSIKLSVEKTTINKNEKVKLNVTISPTEAQHQKIQFLSSNNAIAMVDSDGYILGLHSGTCTITAKATNNVSSSIDITVYSPVTDLILDTTNVIMQIGKNFKINTFVYPKDASNSNIKYSSNNTNIATIDNSGLINGVNIGNAQILVKSADGNISKNINVQVIDKISEDILKFDESLSVNANQISGLDYTNNSVSDIKNLITTTFDIEFFTKDGQVLDNSSLIGTGSKLRLYRDNTLVLEYEFILYGDVNGDGRINSVDLLVLQRHILEIQKFDGVFLKAGNINKNANLPSSVDLLIIQRHILELKIIDQ